MKYKNDLNLRKLTLCQAQSGNYERVKFSAKRRYKAENNDKFDYNKYGFLNFSLN